MGIASGIILFLVCLSGTIYTFRTEIEKWMEPNKFYHSQTNQHPPLSADVIITNVESRYQGKVVSVTIPSNRSMNWQLAVKKPGEKGRPKSYFINPINTETAGEQGGTTSDFFTTVMKMHRWLMMEESTGRVVVGVATIIMCLMVITGIILWFPAQLRYIKQGLRIKFSANWKRINHDLHNVLGFYAFIILLVMTLTGLCWSFEWYRNGVSNVLGAKVFRGRGEKPMISEKKDGSAGTASANVVITEMQKLFPYDGVLRISIPEEANSAITATKSKTGFFAMSGSDKVQFNAFTGEALKVERFRDKRANVQIADSIRAIHTGEIFGTASKIIYFLACLIATSLPVTGTIIWLNKMKKKNKPVGVARTSNKEFA
jgi:uncharacterized iron-regulated membrane protein